MSTGGGDAAGGTSGFYEQAGTADGGALTDGIIDGTASMLGSVPLVGVVFSAGAVFGSGEGGDGFEIRGGVRDGAVVVGALPCETRTCLWCSESRLRESKEVNG